MDTADRSSERGLTERIDQLERRLYKFDKERLSWFGRLYVGSLHLGLIVIAAHLVLLCSGVGLIIALPAIQSLGISLTVGSIFGLGSFGGQLWSQQINREREFRERFRTKDDQKERDDLMQAIQSLRLELARTQLKRST